ncbi:MAG: hypothetical protein JNL74_16465, partial [Fibrobacteres bacterium]|nr:hypothetical protein [Fibrobacterota bacterium]
YMFPLLLILYLMQILRPHIAAILMIAFSIAFVYRVRNKRPDGNNVGALGRLFLPLLLVLGVFAFTVISLQRLGVDKGEGISTDAIKETLIAGSQMGAYGGSSTGMSEVLQDDPGLIFNPLVIGKNVLNLFFAPLPWQIRGAADLIAIISNFILFYLMYRFIRKVRIYDEFQIFLLVSTIGLSLLLSFMTGNVGLILRQKTIILPFLFLLMFSRPPEELALEEEQE